MESAPRPPPPSTPPPPPPEAAFPKESLTRRYKFIWRFLLISNLALGAYMFARPKKKDVTRTAPPVGARRVHKTVEEAPVTPDTSLYDWTADEDYVDAMPIAELVKVREPISEEQQRELFHWMLEEKRKLTPKNAEEKRQIDQDKATLKKFIRAKFVPEL